jgi:chaperonin GroES
MLKPVNGNLVLKKAKVENTTSSGIVLSDQKEEDFATIIAISDSIDDKGVSIPCPFKVGEKVVYKSYSPTKVTYEGEEYLVIASKEVIAIIE